MTNDQIKEALSRNFVSAIAQVHGVKCLRPEPDHGVDITFCPVNKITKPDGSIRHLDSANKLDVQIKSTTSNSVQWAAASVKYDVEAKTYNDLIYRKDDPLPLYLVVVIFDTAPPTCLDLRPAELAIMGQAYWYLPDPNATVTANSQKIRINIPLANKIDMGFVPMIYSSAGYTI